MGSIAEGDGDIVLHRRREVRCGSLTIVYGRIYINPRARGQLQTYTKPENGHASFSPPLGLAAKKKKKKRQKCAPPCSSGASPLPPWPPPRSSSAWSIPTTQPPRPSCKSLPPPTWPSYSRLLFDNSEHLGSQCCPERTADVILFERECSYVYVPDTVKSDALVVVVHSCQSSGESYFRNSKIPWKQGSDKGGYVTFWPSSPNSGTCWDVSSKRSLSHLGGGDSQAIANMIVWGIDKFKIDPKKVFVTGGSSGGTCLPRTPWEEEGRPRREKQ